MIYLDHHAATPLDPAAQEAMVRAREFGWANASSTHQAGRAARAIVERAREQVAGAIQAAPADVVLTSGGTEACNLAVLGMGGAARRLVTTEIEHPAIAEPVQQLANQGTEVHALPCPAGAPPDPDALASMVDAHTLVAVQWVNHETGTLMPIERYAQVCAERGATFVVDATQALGKVPISVDAMPADAMAFAAQKVGGPASAGALWLRRGQTLTPRLWGGEQERGRRAGTLDAVSMAGFGAACERVPDRIERQPALRRLRDALETELVDVHGAMVNGEGPRVATACNVSFAGRRGAVLVAALDVEGVCVSTGAACSSGLQTPSKVITAMYPDAQWRAASAVRISLGTSTDSDAIRATLQAFQRVLRRDIQKLR